MAAKTRGQLIKEARTAAGFTQEEIGGILGSVLNNPEIKDALSGLQSLL